MKENTKTRIKGQGGGAWVLTVAVVLWAMAAGWGLRTYQSWNAWDAAPVVDVNRPVDANDAALKKVLAHDKEVADALVKKNLIAPPPPEQNPIREVTGILGNEALINGKWYTVGDKVGEAEILAIEATLVKVSWKGQESTLKPMGSSGGGDGGPGPGGAKGLRAGSRAGVSARGADAAAQPARAGRAIRGLPDGMTPEQIQNMSPEERRALFEKMRNQ